MAEIITEDFRQSLRSSPNGQRSNGTPIDELYSSLETSENPLDRVLQMIAEYHGPWSGGSRQLADFSAFLATITKSTSLKNLTIEIANAACAVERAVGDLPPSSVGKSNPTTFALMPTPLLREFITKSQQIHPSINMYIQNNIGTFPYYQPVSEDIGSYVNINMRRTSIDPLKWLDRDGDCQNAPGVSNRKMRNKISNCIFQMMVGANNITDALYLRSLPRDNNMAYFYPNYASSGPIAHGHNYTMDVFNAQRERDAIPLCAAVILTLAQDVLRLLNNFFCFKELSRYSVEGFEITMYEGPSGEPITYIVDNSFRPIYDDEYSNTLNDPTNDRVINTKKEDSKESS